MNQSMPYFYFETSYQPEEWRIWSSQLVNQWLGVPIAMLYVLIIFALKSFMQQRERLELKNVLIMWNFCLAIFSWFGSIRMVPFFWDIVSKNGVDYSLCNDAVFRNPVTGFWISLFVFSKVFELFDTFFIVMRKQKLIFLHWYHHASVVIFVFCNWHAWPGIGIWQTTMNYFVHSVMYSYYMLRSMSFKPPLIINKAITVLQIVQMVLACCLGGRSFYFIASGRGCGTDTWFTSTFAFALYSSYLILFVHFFIKTYNQRTVPEKKKAD